MTRDESYDRVLLAQRARFWEGLPTKAYRVRQLVRKHRNDELQPGEREELELTVKRLARTATALGFEDVGAIATRLSGLLWRARSGATVDEPIEHLCDGLDQLIDDISVEALAAGLRTLWDD